MTLTAKTSSAAINQPGKAQNAWDSPNIPQGFSPGNHPLMVAVVEYDFARDGSPTPHATAGMGMGVFLPKNAVVTRTWAVVETAITGPTNVYMSLENDGDLVVSGTIAANEFDVAGDVIVGSVADIIGQTAAATTAVASASVVKTTAPREVIFGCTVAAVTAGKFQFFIEYVVVGDAN